METRIRRELERSILSNDMLRFKDELVKKLGKRIKQLTMDELWPVFQKVAGNCNIDWESEKEPVYDDGIDYSSKTKKIKAEMIDYFVEEVISYIEKRRAALRFDFQESVAVYTVEPMDIYPFIARLENISATGMLLQSRIPFDSGTKLELRLHKKNTDEQVRFFVTVIRSEDLTPTEFKVGAHINSVSDGTNEKSRITDEDAYQLAKERYY